jgi:hypothetical protein
MAVIVIAPSNKFVLMSKLVDEKRHGIIINTIKGLVIPPVKYIKKLSCKISTFKNKKANLLFK